MLNEKPKRRVCIVSPRIDAIEEWFKDHLTLLSQAGNIVTVLYVHEENKDNEKLAESINRFIKNGIECVPLKLETIKAQSAYHIKLSYEIFVWLSRQENRFDVVHFRECLGQGYYTVLAKHQGLTFLHTTFCVTIQKPHLWNKANQHQCIDSVADLEIDFMEKESVRLADRVICKEASLLKWLQDNEWQLPEKCITERDWIFLHEELASLTPNPVFETQTSFPLVSVCLITFNRVNFLSHALESLRAQDYPNFEVILVDDGSTGLDAKTYLEQLKPEFSERGWKIIHQKNSFSGAARNNAARNSLGEYLLFMDDDNYAKPEEISTFIKVMQHTNADILTAASVMFKSDENPATSPDIMKQLWVFLGGATSLGVFINCFGDTNAMIRRSAFEALGGFTEDYGVSYEDWEIFSRAVLKGFHLETIPLPLFYYRVQPNSLMRSIDSYINNRRGIRPYTELAPPAYEQILWCAHGMHRLTQEMSRQNKLLTTELTLAKATIKDLKNSMSWKITQPLRQLKKAILE